MNDVPDEPPGKFDYNLEPFCVEFVQSSCISMDSLQVLPLPPTVYRPTY